MEQQGEAVIIFIEVENIQELIKTEKKGITQLFENFFKEIDQICLNNNIQKIEVKLLNKKLNI